jgi:hypothetical protein
MVLHWALAYALLSGTGDHQSEPFREDTGAKRGDTLGAEQGPVLVQKLEPALLNSTRRGGMTRQRAWCLKMLEPDSAIHAAQNKDQCSSKS